MRQLPTLLVAVATALLLGACSRRPSEEEMERLVASGSGPLAEWSEVRNFRKVNGRDLGHGEYEAWLEFDLVFLRSSEDIKDALGAAGAPKDASGEVDLKSAMGAALESMGSMLALALIGEFDAGHTEHRELKVRFVETENGWIIQPREE